MIRAAHRSPLPRALGPFLRLLAFSLAAACSAPDVRPDLAGSGFRTPEQTFSTFRAAFVADLPELEYRCLSAGFTARNGLSRLAYREGRDEWLQRQPFLRRGLGDARIETVVPLTEDAATLRVRSHGFWHDVRFEVLLVREDFYELWSADRRVQDDFAPFRETVLRQGEWVTAGIPMRDPTVFDALTEVRFGREWKIDDLRLVGETPP